MLSRSAQRIKQIFVVARVLADVSLRARRRALLGKSAWFSFLVSNDSIGCGFPAIG